MKKLLIAALLSVGFLSIPSKATASFFPIKIQAGGNFYLKILPHGGGAGGGYQLGPWYNYWPLEAHFQQPAPLAYPPWPGSMSLPPNFGAQGGYYNGGGAAPGGEHAPPATQGASTTAPVYKPVQWAPQAAPAYWYNR